MTTTYEPSDVLINLREPYNKNTVWIQPINGVINIKLYDKGKWNIIYSTEDKGLSEASLSKVKELVDSLNTELTKKIAKQLGQYSSNSLLLVKKQKELETKISELESKIEKLANRYSSLLLKNQK